MTTKDSEAPKWMAFFLVLATGTRAWHLKTKALWASRPFWWTYVSSSRWDQDMSTYQLSTNQPFYFPSSRRPFKDLKNNQANKQQPIEWSWASGFLVCHSLSRGSFSEPAVCMFLQLPVMWASACRFEISQLLPTTFKIFPVFNWQRKQTDQDPWTVNKIE